MSIKLLWMALAILSVATTHAFLLMPTVPSLTSSSTNIHTARVARPSFLAASLCDDNSKKSNNIINNINNNNINNNNDKNHDIMMIKAQQSSSSSVAATILAAMWLVVATTLGQPMMAAAESRVVGEISGSGLIFKDTLVVESFDDPKVQGVTLYISNFQRPLTERLSKDFFSDPSYASVACAKTTTGAVAIADNIAKGKGGEEVFEESRSLLFKTLRVQRIYDEEKKTVVYVSFNTRWNKDDDANKSRFKSSICAVNLE